MNIVGVVSGLASPILDVYRTLTDRGSLRVTCGIEDVPLPISFLDSPRQTVPHLVFRITNAGNRPIYLVKVGGGRGRELFDVWTDVDLPIELKPHQPLTVIVLKRPESILLQDHGVDFLGAWDSMGKLYKIPKGDLQRLKADATQRDGSGGRAA